MMIQTIIMLRRFRLSKLRSVSHAFESVGRVRTGMEAYEEAPVSVYLVCGCKKDRLAGGQAILPEKSGRPVASAVQ